MKSMSIKQLIQKLKPFFMALRRYGPLLFILMLVIVYGFLVFRINTLAQAEPSDDAIAEKLNTVKRPKVDQSAIDKINQLQGQNIEVKSLFDQARNNPFNE